MPGAPLAPASSALKRSKSFGVQQCVSFAPNKRRCHAPVLGRRNSATVAALYSLSSSDEEDDDDNSQDDSCYINHQKRARKRAHSIRLNSNSFLNNRLSHAISKYSDDDEEEDEANQEDKKREALKMTKAEQRELKKEKLDGEKMISSLVSDITRRDSMTSVGFSSEGRSIMKKAIDADCTARNRCFDYLVGAIDEAWARYCDATSYAEDEVYNNSSYLPNTPASLGASENEDEDDEHRSDDDDDVEAGYKSASTNLTEYDSDAELRKISGQPSSVRLQHLKDRLLKAKYYLQDYIETDDLDEAFLFWKRWDLVKYATIELVEDDDDDEVVESTIEDLEKGRHASCY